MTRHYLIRIVAALMLCWTLIPPTPGASRSLAQASLLSENAPRGVTVEPLAVANFDSLVVDPRSYLQIVLMRVPIDPGERIDMRNGEEVEAGLGIEAEVYADHDHLLYIESGEIVLSSTGGDEVLGPGSQEIQPEGSPYSIRNDSTECASVLRLSAGTIGGLAGSGASEEVPAIPVPCGEPTLLLRTYGDRFNAEPDMLLFLARATWGTGQDRTTFEWTHANPTGILLESGSLLFQESGEDRGTEIRLHEGSGIETLPYTTYRARTPVATPAVTLMIGTVAEGGMLWTSPHYVGEIFPFRLAWDGSWLISAEYRRPGAYEYLQATHYQTGAAVTIAVFDEGFPDTYTPFDIDPAGCVNEAAALLQDDPSVDNIQLLLETAPRVPTRGDDPGTRALYSYTYTNGLGNESERVMYVECRAIRPETTMKVTSYMARNDLENSVATIQSLLNGLVIPEMP